MKSKILNLLLIITSLLGYLEWGKDNKAFLYKVEGELILKISTSPSAVLHPFTLIPLFGQLLLLISLFQKKSGKIITFIGIGSIGILLVFMFLIGLISLNMMILASTLPFLAIAAITIRTHLKNDKALQ